MKPTTSFKPRPQPKPAATPNAFVKKADGSLLTPKFRVSFPYVFQPNDDGKYGCVMIFSGDVDFTPLEELIEETIAAKWPKGAPEGLMTPILDGADADREEYAGNFYINGKCGKYKPGVCDQALVEITDPEEFYPGCYARATITCYAWSFKGKNGVSVNIRNIQKLEDGEPLVSRVRPDDDFNAVQSEDDL